MANFLSYPAATLDLMAKWTQRRRLIDRNPNTPEQEWLDQLAQEGWVPEHNTGTEVVINGRTVVRYAMILRTQKPPQVL